MEFPRWENGVHNWNFKKSDMVYESLIWAFYQRTITLAATLWLGRFRSEERISGYWKNWQIKQLRESQLETFLLDEWKGGRNVQCIEKCELRGYSAHMFLRRKKNVFYCRIKVFFSPLINERIANRKNFIIYEMIASKRTQNETKRNRTQNTLIVWNMKKKKKWNE